MSPGEQTRDFYRKQGADQERERIIKLLEETIVNSVKWQMTNRYWNDGKNEWNGGQDSDNKYLQSMAGYLLAQILGEHELYKIAEEETE